MIWLHIFQHKRYASLKANVFITLYATVMLFLMCFLPCMHHWDSMAVGSLFLIWCAPMRNLSISNIIYTSDIPRKPLCSLPCKHQWRTSVFLTLYSQFRFQICSLLLVWYASLGNFVSYLIFTIEEPLCSLPCKHHWGTSVFLTLNAPLRFKGGSLFLPDMHQWRTCVPYLVCTNEEHVFLTLYAPVIFQGCSPLLLASQRKENLN